MTGSGFLIELPDAVVEVIIEQVTTIVVERMVALKNTTESDSPYLTIPEAAAYLRCSRQRIDDLLSQRRLTRVKEGRRTLVLRAEIERHLVRQDRRE